MADMITATLTLPYECWTSVQQQIAKLEAELAQAQLAVRSSLAATVSPEAQGLLDGLLAARFLVAFSIGELPPETTKGWPVAQLITFANALKKVVGDDPDIETTAVDLLRFADEVVAVESIREERKRAAREGREPNEVKFERTPMMGAAPPTVEEQVRSQTTVPGLLSAVDMANEHHDR